MCIKKNIVCGKYDWFKTGRKNNEIVLEIEIRNIENKPELSICGCVYNKTKTDCVAAGQIIDSLVEFHSDFKPNGRFGKIIDIWKKHHLNGMHAGTVEQENALKDFDSYNYTEQCEYLKNVNLYTVKLNGEDYTYGSAWLYRELPESVIDYIKSL